MEPKYKIIPDLQSPGCFTIHPNTAKRKNLSSLKKWFLRFGLQAIEMKLKTSSKVDENEVKLSVEIIEALNIPLCGRYEVRPVGNEILLGPYIGVLVASDHDGLEKVVRPFSNYLYSYPHIGGAVVLFSLEGIDPARYTIEGYLYNPDTEDWEWGVYSYPASVFKLIHFGKRWRNHFQTVFGNRFFNSYVFNKWEMFDWLCRVPQLKAHLPETVLYEKPRDLESFLEKHRRIYVKPVNGSMGIGVFQVTRSENRLNIAYDAKGVHYETSVADAADLAKFFKSRFNGKKYILQQALNLISWNGQKIDFRVVLVKDGAGVWRDLGMVARYGRGGSVVTNISAGGSAEVGEKTLRRMFGLSEEEMFRWRKQISAIVLSAARRIEQVGVHCGNLGIDIGIDADRNVWIIEMNNMNPSPMIALDIGDRQMFYQIKRMNLLYAKRLAGFPEE